MANTTPPKTPVVAAVLIWTCACFLSLLIGQSNAQDGSCHTRRGDCNLNEEYICQLNAKKLVVPALKPRASPYRKCSSREYRELFKAVEPIAFQNSCPVKCEVGGERFVTCADVTGQQGLRYIPVIFPLDVPNTARSAFAKHAAEGAVMAYGTSSAMMSHPDYSFSCDRDNENVMK